MLSRPFLQKSQEKNVLDTSAAESIWESPACNHWVVSELSFSSKVNRNLERVTFVRFPELDWSYRMHRHVYYVRCLITKHSSPGMLTQGIDPKTWLRNRRCSFVLFRPRCKNTKLHTTASGGWELNMRMATPHRRSSSKVTILYRNQ